MKPKMYIINTDASIEPKNPGGIIAWAFIARLRKGDEVYRNCNLSKKRGKTTNNQGEYMAVLAAILWLIRIPEERQYPVIIQSDSRLVVDQCSGQSNCNVEELLKFRDLIRDGMKEYSCSIKFKWIPRAKNYEADDLSRTMYDADPRIREEIEAIRRGDVEELNADDDDIPW